MKATNESRPAYRVGVLVVDGRACEVLKFGARVPLTPVQFEVFYQLVQHKGALVKRGEFMPWKRDALGGDRHPVDNEVVVLRRRLGDSIIDRVWGQGYRLQAGLSVEILKSPSRSEIERRLTIALDQLNTHTSSGFRASIENCQELLQAGRIADACSTTALAYINLGHAGFCRENWDISIQRAQEVLATALETFPKLGSAYALRGLAYLIHDYDWDRADADFVTALECSPDNEFAHCFLAHRLTAAGSFESALAHARTAAEVDYGNPMSVAVEPWMMLLAGRVELAVTKAEAVVRQFGSSGPVRNILGDAYCAAGAMGKALEQYRAARAIEFLPQVVACEGFVYGRLGRRRDALRCLTELQKESESGTIAYVSSWHKALIHAGLGEKKRALDALDKAFEEKCDWLVQAAVEPRWKELRDEKRFQDLLRRVGIKKPTKSL